MEKAIFGGGCFWCTEAVFEHTQGVGKVVAGYAGGDISNPTYREVSSGRTGHAEAVLIEYNPDVVSYEELLLIFFKTHDPTTLNRQGADVGPQYRSVIFYRNQAQKETAEKTIRSLQKAEVWEDPIVTEVSPYRNFFPAETEHQDFYQNNKAQPYCQIVINPKLKKFKAQFGEKYKN